MALAYNRGFKKLMFVLMLVRYPMEMRARLASDSLERHPDNKNAKYSPCVEI
jgi:hypothetical protein